MGRRVERDRRSITDPIPLITESGEDEEFCYVLDSDSNLPTIKEAVTPGAAVVDGPETVPFDLGEALRNGLFRRLVDGDTDVAYTSDGRAVLLPERLYLLMLLQLQEFMTDRQAARALESRKEWQQALRIPARQKKLYPAAYGVFRRRMAMRSWDRRHFDAFLDRLRAILKTTPGTPDVPGASSLLAALQELNDHGAPRMHQQAHRRLAD